MLGAGRLFRYFREVRSEMALVSWPSRSTTIRLTLLVIIASIVVGLVVGAIDFAFAEVFKLLIGR